MCLQLHYLTLYSSTVRTEGSDDCGQRHWHMKGVLNEVEKTPCTPWYSWILTQTPASTLPAHAQIHHSSNVAVCLGWMWWLLWALGNEHTVCQTNSVVILFWNAVTTRSILPGVVAFPWSWRFTVFRWQVVSVRKESFSIHCGSSSSGSSLPLLATNSRI
jgi:hypothetical protein